jgi:hypothetical protein
MRPQPPVRAPIRRRVSNCITDLPSPNAAKTARRPPWTAHRTMARWCGKNGRKLISALGDAGLPAVDADAKALERWSLLRSAMSRRDPLDPQDIASDVYRGQCWTRSNARRVRQSVGERAVRPVWSTGGPQPG